MEILGAQLFQPANCGMLLSNKYSLIRTLFVVLWLANIYIYIRITTYIYTPFLAFTYGWVTSQSLLVQTGFTPPSRTFVILNIEDVN